MPPLRRRRPDTMTSQHRPDRTSNASRRAAVRTAWIVAVVAMAVYVVFMLGTAAGQ